MTDWDKLAEARIQEWLHRPEDARETSMRDPALPLEMQLLEQVRELYEDARKAAPADASRIWKRAAEVETRLLVLLESSGRPLAARRFAELLQELRAAQRA